jgi:DNA-binding PadR family transcriptional regulator
MQGTINALGRLRNLDLVEYGQPNDTYRITDLGRAALKQERDNG